MVTRYLLPVAAAVAAGFAAVQVSRAQQKPPPAAPPVEPARSPFRAQLAGAGMVEPATENVAAGAHVPGVVDEVFVRVGDTVPPGGPLFRLDDRHLRAELETRLAALASADAALARLAAQPRPEEVPPAAAKVAEARAAVKDADVQYERMRKLALTAAASDEEVTRRASAAEVARAQLAKAEADLALLKAGAWGPDRATQEAAVRQAKAQADQTRTELDRLTVRAPRAAAGGTAPPAYTVLQVNVRPGEYVAAGQGSPMILGLVGRPHVRVDVDESDIHRFRPGLPGVGRPRGRPDEAFPLTFVRVEPFVIPKRSLTGGNTERVDTRVLQVIYALDPGDRTLYVGQQLDVFIDTAADPKK